MHRKTELPGVIVMISKKKKVLLVFGRVTKCPESGPTVDSIPPPAPPTPKAAGLRSCFLVTNLKRGDEAKTNSTGSNKHSSKDQRIHPAPASFTDRVCSPHQTRLKLAASTFGTVLVLSIYKLKIFLKKTLLARVLLLNRG